MQRILPFDLAVELACLQDKLKINYQCQMCMAIISSIVAIAKRRKNLFVFIGFSQANSFLLLKISFAILTGPMKSRHDKRSRNNPI